MPEKPRPFTAVDAIFAGRSRTFDLRIGELGELERICNAGIGEIALRLSTHQFRHADIRETIRLGLRGGGLGDAEATALVMTIVDGHPLADHLELAQSIVGGLLHGMPAKKAPAEGQATASPATSPPSTTPAA